MIVFVPAVYPYYEKYDITLKQFDSVAMPIYRELLRRSIDAKWGTWNDDADLYVCSNPYKPMIDINKLVYCPDGLGLGEAVPAIYGGILFLGPYWRQYFENAYGKSHGKTDTENDLRYPSVGWPPLDLWFNSEGKEKRKHLRETLNLPFDKTVLFGGLYDGMGGYASNYMKATINRFIDYNEKYPRYNIIYKGHVLSTMAFHGRHDARISRNWLPLKNRMDELYYCNFVNPIDSGNVFDYSLVSDIFVSGEGCSALTAFMAVGIPTVQLGMRWHTGVGSRIGEAYIGAKERVIGYSYSVKNHHPLRPQIFMPGYVAEPTNLPEVVSHALCYPQHYEDEVSAFVKEMLYEVDGKVSERAVDAILRIQGE